MKGGDDRSPGGKDKGNELDQNKFTINAST